MSKGWHVINFRHLKNGEVKVEDLGYPRAFESKFWLTSLPNVIFQSDTLIVRYWPDSFGEEYTQISVLEDL